MRTFKLAAALIPCWLLQACTLPGLATAQDMQARGVDHSEVVQGNFEDIYSRVTDRAHSCYSQVSLWRPTYMITGDIFADRRAAQIRIEAGYNGAGGIVALVTITAAADATSKIVVTAMPKDTDIANALSAWSAGKSSECYPG